MGETDATAPRLRLYDTLRKEKVAFTPLDPANVRMYVCGPTVYDYAHIGNARPVIVFDVLFRLLRHLYGPEHVRYARNITDVDDKINARAARDHPGLPLNEAIAKVTAQTEAQFEADVTALGCLPPTVQPHATDHIEDMKAIIYRLHDRDFAYVAQDHVLFSPNAMEERARQMGLPRYGSLSRRSLDEMIAGARVDVAPYKRNETDFVLWKPSSPGQPGWPSPLNIIPYGRPGWHIECSAMSMATLLEPFGGGLSCEDPDRNTFDIHGGGIDLVFPHHENEIAQSCCAFGSERMAQIWMHNGFLQVEGRKMSKSDGNFVTIHDLLHTDTFGGRRWPGEVLRLAMLKTHYRQPIDWTVKALEEAEKTLNQWIHISKKNTSAEPKIDLDIVEALQDDINFPKALARFNWLSSASYVYPNAAGLSRQEAVSRLIGSAELIGIDLKALGKDQNEFDFKRAKLSRTVEPLIDARLAARRAKNFAESDRIRDELVAMGIQIMDGKDPVTGELTTRWEVKR